MPVCETPGCVQSQHKRRLCFAHYGLIPGVPLCVVAGCSAVVYARDWCCSHYRRWQKYGDPLMQPPRGNPVTHGMTGTREYSTWCSMKERCYEKSSTSYPNYGGRGIFICARWRSRFAAFYADMGPRPEGTTIDRINNSGGYWCGRCAECLASRHPMNCRWADGTTQRRNQRKRTNTASQYQGVSRHSNRWRAYIELSGRQVHLGQHRSEIQAAIAYDNFIRMHEPRGWTDGRLNFPGVRYVSRLPGRYVRS